MLCQNTNGGIVSDSSIQTRPNRIGRPHSLPACLTMAARAPPNPGQDEWRSPLLGLGVSSEARNGKRTGTHPGRSLARNRNILYISLQDITASGFAAPHPTGFRSALLARLVAATRQPARAICTIATRSGRRVYLSRPLSSSLRSSAVQSATPSATIARTGAT